MALINTTTTGVLGTTVYGDGSGALTVQQNGVTQGIFGNIPAFSVYPNATFTASSSTWTIVQCNTEEFDTASYFNNTGSTVNGVPAYSYLPTIAGYYQMNACWSLGAGSTFSRSLCAIYKNGSMYKQGLDNTTSTATGSNISTLIYLNGTTDYASFYLYESGSGTNTINANTTWFNGYLVKAA